MPGKFVLSFECDNEAFADYPADAIAFVLQSVSRQVHKNLTNDTQPVFDHKGNRIGSFRYEA